MAIKTHAMGFIERNLTLPVGLCIAAGILLGKFAPDLAGTLDAMSIEVKGALVISTPVGSKYRA